jgi:hypothetical protein
MHPRAFDQWTTVLASHPTRRGAVRLLVGCVLGSLPSWRTDGATLAKAKKQCKAGLTRCGKACVNLKTDPRHCGSCARVCQAGQHCQARHCVTDGCVPNCTGKDCGGDGCGGSCGPCPTGKTCDTQGKCVCQPTCAGKACGDDGCGGHCGQCPAGKTCCGGSCVDLESDPAHCGTCDNPCAVGVTCQQKRCCLALGTACTGPGGCCLSSMDCDSVDPFKGRGAAVCLATGATVCCLSAQQGCRNDCDCCGTMRCSATHECCIPPGETGCSTDEDCCHRSCDTATGTCCKPAGTPCDFNTPGDCCSNVCDVGQTFLFECS